MAPPESRGRLFHRRGIQCVSFALRYAGFTGEIIYQSEEDLLPDQGKDAILALLIRHIHAAIDAVKGKPGQIFAISVGIPGYLNEDKSIALSHFRLKDWENVPVKKI